jgi:large subunit ribosomal protein L30
MKVRITQVKSTIKRKQSQKDTMRALGLGKVNRTVEHEVNPQVLGMIKKVSHLVKLEEI